MLAQTGRRNLGGDVVIDIAQLRKPRRQVRHDVVVVHLTRGRATNKQTNKQTNKHAKDAVREPTGGRREGLVDGSMVQRVGG